jgi:Protein of unknown function (DUF429)
VIEVHPEVSFAALAGRPLRNSKRSWNDQMEQRRLLASAGIELPDELFGVIRGGGRRSVPPANGVIPRSELSFGTPQGKTWRLRPHIQ